MKISGTRSIITFDYENGYVLKAKGELLTDGSFTVYNLVFLEFLTKV
ncbi:hypothetical protein TZ93_01696 [Streptococcus mitis]|uniref:Uncharacterized protein n=1 Tax=Streptococcus mitis TaxID=28037 RepID=A0A0F2DNT7_STRMT|nr:hypothetical protein [Streptococcus mitis]KJQ71904.1 hypothetical protein TZ93_01696 [Streptococcus mitis]